MGCTSSKAKAPADPSVDSTALTSSVDSSTEFDTGACPKSQQLYSHSLLCAPPNFGDLGASLSAMVMVHGFCFQAELQCDIAGMALSVTRRRLDWKCLAFLVREVAKQGVAVLTIDMHDNDLEVLCADFPDLSQAQKDLVRGVGIGTSWLGNGWPATYYTRAIDAAIDHVREACSQKLRLEIDANRVGLLGWSMGAAGVLHAAGTSRCGRVKCVATMNPGYLSVLAPFNVSTSDTTAPPELYAHLATISAYETGRLTPMSIKSLLSPATRDVPVLRSNTGRSRGLGERGFPVADLWVRVCHCMPCLLRPLLASLVFRSRSKTSPLHHHRNTGSLSSPEEPPPPTLHIPGFVVRSALPP